MDRVRRWLSLGHLLGERPPVGENPRQVQVTCCTSIIANATDENLQIGPSPFVHFVGRLCSRGLGARLVGIPLKQEVGQLFLLSDFKFVADPCGGGGVLTTDHNHLLAFLDAFLHLLFPIASERFLPRKWTLRLRGF